MTCGAWILLPLLTGWPSTGVTITGGPDETGQWYQWTVRNDTPVSIVAVCFPHYHADLFIPPETWNSRCTHLVNVGAVDAPGECEATAPSPAAGIAPKGTARFRMRLSTKGAARGTGQVRVTFADGSSTVIDGIEVPVRPSASETYLPLVGLGAIVAIVGIWRMIRRPRAVHPS